LDHTWRDDAACRGIDPELFFPTRGGDTRQPRAVCADCPVRTDCLEHAITTNEKVGIWGGLSERERRQLRRRRRAS
jgi:WhiB family redox-sensing transcriptional regulator